jgi:hypothetical protein
MTIIIITISCFQIFWFVTSLGFPKNTSNHRDCRVGARCDPQAASKRKRDGQGGIGVEAPPKKIKNKAAT